MVSEHAEKITESGLCLECLDRLRLRFRGQRTLVISLIFDYLVTVQGVQVTGILVGQSQNDTMHTDESYRSHPNLVFPYRTTQDDVFHSQKIVILTTIMFLDHLFSLYDPRCPQNGRNVLVRR